jgi:hypothetical protein
MGDNEGRENWAPNMRQSAYKAEGVGFEPTRRLTTPKGFETDVGPHPGTVAPKVGERATV